MSGEGTRPGDFIEFDLQAIEAERQREITVELLKAARTLSAELGRELRVAKIDGHQVLADETGVRYRADVTRNGRLEVTAVLPGTLL